MHGVGRLQSDSLLLRMLMATGAQRVSIASRSVWALFDNEYFESGQQPGVEGRQPILTCRESDLSDVVKDMVVVVGPENYRVKRIEPDGTGMARVLLKR